jgi:type VI protein secretion system component VasF
MQNRIKTQQDKLNEHYAKMQKEYQKESLGTVWFFIIIGVALLLTALIENI